MQLNFFKNKKIFKKGGIHINPNVYWAASLLIAAVLIAAGVFFGFNLFRKINQELITASDSDSIKIQTTDGERIKKVIEYFSEKEQKSLQILNSRAPVVDPSL